MHFNDEELITLKYALRLAIDYTEQRIERLEKHEGNLPITMKNRRKELQEMQQLYEKVKRH